MQLANTLQTIEVVLSNNETATIYVNSKGNYHFYTKSGYDTSEGNKAYKSLDAIFKKLKEYEKMCMEND